MLIFIDSVRKFEHTEVFLSNDSFDMLWRKFHQRIKKKPLQTFGLFHSVRNVDMQHDHVYCKQRLKEKFEKNKRKKPVKNAVITDPLVIVCYGHSRNDRTLW